MMSKSRLDAENPGSERPDWWFTIISAAGAFAVIAASVTSWLPISDTILSHLRVPVSTLASLIGGTLAYFGIHHHR